MKLAPMVLASAATRGSRVAMKGGNDMTDLLVGAMALGRGSFRTITDLEAFFSETLRPIASRRVSEDRTLVTYEGALVRVHAWLRSLRKLDHPEDFQPILAGTRALFEIAVDLTLLIHDPAATQGRLFAWEQSAKLKAAEATLRYYADRDEAIPSELDGQARFVRDCGRRDRSCARAVATRAGAAAPGG